MNHHIFIGIITVRYIISFPGSDIDSSKFNLVCSCHRFLADAQVVCCDLARKIFCIDISAVMARSSVNGKGQKGLTGGNGLRHDNGSELSVVVHRDDSCQRDFTFRSDDSCRKVDGRLTDGICDQNLFGHRSIFCSVCPACSLRETHSCRGHLMTEGQDNL